MSPPLQAGLIFTNNSPWGNSVSCNKHQMPWLLLLRLPREQLFGAPHNHSHRHRLPLGEAVPRHPRNRRGAPAAERGVCQPPAANQTRVFLIRTSPGSPGQTCSCAEAKAVSRQSLHPAPGATAPGTTSPLPGPSLGLRCEGDVLLLPDVLLVGAAVVELLDPLLAAGFEQGDVSLCEEHRWA